jgi:thiamine-monophosphate kinase
VRALCETNNLGARLHGDIELDEIVTRIAAAAGVSTFEVGQTWGDWSLLVAVRPEDMVRAQAVLAGVDAGVRDVGVLSAEAGVLERAGQAWEGVDQERFSPTSWHGAGVQAAVAAMQERSRGAV